MDFRVLGRCFVAAVFAVGLIGCGGSSSGGGKAAVPPTPFNVASQDNGGVATATYDSANAGLINDAIFDLVEKVNQGSFWAGNANGDLITIALDGSHLVSQFVLYTNKTNNSDTTIQYSTDGATFTSIAIFSDCPTASIGSGRIDCTFASAKKMTHLRVLVNSNATDVRLYELIAMGLPEA